MIIKPMAMGMLVVPELIEFQKSATDGEKYPQSTPTSIARKIQRVRNLSRKDNFFMVC
ncbi:MAG: hypothetical protein NTV01_05940 [Bacteroidia bacterium]|nr:hypothetical protein [Bacteroidia bacterium]